MKKLTIFCGSSSGTEPYFMKGAFYVGEVLAENDIEVVYGGAKIGLMGAIADGALSKGGKVTGIIPDFLSDKEVRHDNLTELITVSSMHERKMLMHTLSDGFVALPGGYGTMEELCEMLTWAQLGLHHKPIGIVNMNGYFDFFAAMVNTMVKNGFLQQKHKDMVLVHEDINFLLSGMKSYSPHSDKVWLREDDV